MRDRTKDTLVALRAEIARSETGPLRRRLRAPAGSMEYADILDLIDVYIEGARRADMLDIELNRDGNAFHSKTGEELRQFPITAGNL